MKTTHVSAAPTHVSGRPVRLGLRENRLQFTLLVIVNICVGGLVGLERTTVPLIGSETFGLTSDLAVFSFIIAFGLTKALTNLAAGALTARFRRKQLLVVGWLLGIPVPFALAWAPSWGWIVAANVLLGLNQGLTWSMTVNMKIDLVGPSRRGLATGLNEAAGYTAVGVTALLTGYLATSYGLRPVPELIGVVFVAAGLALALALALVVRDTAAHVALELTQHAKPLPTDENTGLKGTFTRTSWHNRSLRGASQAGLVNNLNDGLTWGVFPLLFTDHGLGLAAVGLIKGLYPILWGLGQIPTGHLADRIGRKPLIVYGMLVQAAGILADTLGLNTTVIAAAVLTAASGLLAAHWITEHRPDTR
ncbi:MFS transporter [Streptomyces exfoliatus]|uniref:MFS transporter n=1 Tax=Streptomyces exfoliatus TaxID=1905 RepID=UPI0004663743|nr:MFS transporter [Streptomyces exfoliatus]